MKLGWALVTLDAASGRLLEQRTQSELFSWYQEFQ